MIYLTTAICFSLTILFIILLEKKNKENLYDMLKTFLGKICKLYDKYCIKLIMKIRKIITFAIISICILTVVYFSINTENINNNYINILINLVNSIFKYILIFVIAILGLYFFIVILSLIGKIIENFNYKKMLNSNNLKNDKKELFMELHSYLKNKKDIRPIFINGVWGAGKTYAVNEYLQSYHKYTFQKVYKISCFGITSKEILMSRIEKACINEDDRLSTSIIEILSKLPIIGDLLYKIFGKKYDIENIKENSIFIFDNFERIEPLKKVNNSAPSNENISANIKYDIVSGVIDELIERYNMKVIIIGNEAEMIDEYVENTFICKLGCKKFNIKPNELTIEYIWNDLLNNEINTGKYKKNLMALFDKVKKGSEILWNESKLENMRIIHSILYNYIDFMIYLYDFNYEFNDSINEELSIYYTIFISNLKTGDSPYFIEKYDNIGLYIYSKYVHMNELDDGGIELLDIMLYDDKKLFKDIEGNYNVLTQKMEEIKKEINNKFLFINSEEIDISSVNSIGLDEAISILFEDYNKNCDLVINLFSNNLIESKSIEDIINILNKIDVYENISNDKEMLKTLFEKYIFKIIVNEDEINTVLENIPEKSDFVNLLEKYKIIINQS